MAKSILLVEDNPDDEALALRAMRKIDIVDEILVAHDGEEAIALLFRSPLEASHLPTVVLLDLKLPKIDGMEVLRRLRASDLTRLIPVVVLTNSNEEQDVVQCYRLGANSYVRKPVDFQVFMDIVRQLGQYWLLTNEPPPLQGANHAAGTH